MIVETHRGIPADKRDAFRANRDKFYVDWAKARHDALNLNGTIYLVVEETRDDVAPGATPRNRIEYYTDKETSKLFTKAEADQTRDRLGKMLKSDANQGLLDMVAFAKTAFVNQFGGKSPLANAVEKQVLNQSKPQVPANHRAEGNKPEAQGEKKMEVGTIVLYLIVGLLAFWILIGLVRAFTRPRVQPGDYNAPPPPPNMGRGGMAPPPPGYGQPYGGQPMGYPQQQAGGMGFMGSLMTGMLGAAAGNFMYDRFFRGGSHGGDYGGSSASTGGGYFGGGSGSSRQPDSGAAYSGGGDYDQADNSPASGGGDYDQGLTGGSGDFGGGGDSSGYSGGGDYGSRGGDTGGGVFGGGGDFGGGGGDFGGGGGDFSGGDSGGGDY
jgi:hypothetical protein